MTPFLCRHGRHSWAFVEMTNARVVVADSHTAAICRLVERCRRRDLVRTNSNAAVPKRVKR